MVKVDCKKYADDILGRVSSLPGKSRSLLILYAGDNPASASYMKGKIRDSERCGIKAMSVQASTQDELMDLIDRANKVDSIGGIIVQLPLPDGWDEDKAVNAVSLEKDVDGFRAGSPFKPCTPEGIMYALKQELGEDLAGYEILLVGKGKLVGKPLISMLLDEGVTLTIAHSRTYDLESALMQWHDAVIVAVGEPVVDLHIVHSPLVIDAGINCGEDGHLCGDCYGDTAWSGQRVTPVPGGVGLMTRAVLMKHMGAVQ